MDNLFTVALLHDLKSTLFAEHFSKFANLSMLCVVFTEVFTFTSKVRALKSLVKTLKSMLVDVSPWYFLGAALALVITSDLKFLELIDNKRMSLTGLKSFKVASRTVFNVFFLSFGDTGATEVNSAVRALTRLLKNVFADYAQ